MLATAEADAGRQAELARAHYARSGQLEQVLGETRQACIERDRRIDYLQTELDLARGEGASQLRALATLGSELEELRVSSRGQATRIRLGALREAAEVSSRIRALAGAPEAAAEGMLAALERALERLGSDWEGAEVGPTSRVEAGVVPAEQAPSIALAAGSGAPPQPAAADPDEPAIAVSATDSELAALEAALTPAAEPAVPAAHSPAVATTSVAARRVSVDIGPFSDFSQLVSFEDAANAIEATSEISIRRFSEGRASIDVSLSEPVDLLAELEAGCDLRFRVRSHAEDEIVLDLGE